MHVRKLNAEGNWRADEPERAIELYRKVLGWEFDGTCKDELHGEYV